MTEQGYEDEEVRRVYRTLPDDEVPAAVDERVLAVAKTALTKRRIPAWKRWSAPIALAASVIVVVAIVLDPGARKTASISSVPMSAPAPTERKAAAPSQQVQGESALEEAPLVLRKEQPPAAKSKPQDSKVTTRREQTLADVPVAVTAVPEVHMAPPPAAAPPAMSAPSAEQQASDARVDQATESARKAEADASAAQEERQRGASNEAVAAARAPSASMQAPSSAEEIRVTAASKQPAGVTRWLQQILTLQNEGKHGRAAREIEKFKQAYPDVDVEEALKALRRDEPRE